MVKTKKQKRNFFFLAIIGLLGVIAPLSFFKHQLPLVGLDTFPPVDIGVRMKEWPYLWGYFSSMLGADFSGRIVVLPQVFCYFLLNLVGLSLVTSQKIIFIQIFLTAGFSMYFLSLTIWKKKYLIALVSSLVFMFNPVAAGFWQQFLPDSLYSFVALPLILALFLRGLESERPFKAATLFSLSTLLFLPYNLAIYILGIGILTVFLIFKFFNRKNKSRMRRFALSAFILTLLFNLWWIVPQAISLPKFVSHYGAEMKETSRVAIQSTRAYLPNTFRLLGSSYWGYSLWDGRVSNNIGFLYETKPLLIFLTFLYPFFAFFSLVFRRKDKTVLFLFFLCIASIFFAKGLNRPFGSLYDWFFRNFPGFFVFRTPSDKFWIVTLLSYSLLIGFSVSEIFNWLAKRSQLFARLIFGSLVLVFLAIQWPFFTGDVIPSGKSALPSVEFNPPHYYQQLSNWLKEQKDSFRILNLPGANRFTRWLAYKWGFLGAYPVLSEFLGRPVVDKQPQAPSDFVRQTVYYQLGNFSDISTIINQQIPTNNSVAKVLGLMNIKYILVNHDTDWQHLHYSTESPEELEEKLAFQKMIKKERNFGNLHLYQIEEGVVLPEIYSSPVGEEALFFGNEKPLGTLFSFEDYSPEKGFYLNPPAGMISEGRKIFIGTSYRYFREISGRNFTEFPAFPFVRILPDSPFYRIVELRDAFRERKFKEKPSLVILARLDLTDKRMAEIDKMIKIKNLHGLAVVRQLYEETIKKIIDVFEKRGEFGKTNDSLALEVKGRLNYQENFLIWAARVLEDQEGEKTIKQILTNFPDWYKSLEKFIRPWWYDSSQVSEKGQVGYEFSIPNEGEYDLFLNTHDLKGANLNYQGRLRIEGKIINHSGETRPLRWLSPGSISPNKWVSLGKFFFKTGDYALVIVNQETENLFDRNKQWEVMGEGKISLLGNMNGDKVKDAYQMEVKRGQPTAFYTAFPNPDPVSTYRISFSYRNISGKPLKFVTFKTREQNFAQGEFEKTFERFLISSKVSRMRKERTNISVFKKYTINILEQQGESLIKESIWQKFIFDCKPGEGANVAGLVFFIDEDESYLYDSVNQITDLRIEKVFDNPVVFRQTGREEPIDQKQTIFFKRINPSRYEMDVKGATTPFKLVFSQSFDPGWKAYISKEKEIKEKVVAEYPRVNSFEMAAENVFFKLAYLKKPGEEINEERHLLINGYANSWYIDKTGDYKIILVYQPQGYFYYCLIISVVIMTVMVSYLFRSRDEHA